MADDKKKKKKKKEDDGTSTEPEAPASTPVSSRPASKKSGGSSKKAKKGGGSNVFDQFSQKQVAEFKEGFQVMDVDKDGVIGAEDLQNTFDSVGKITTRDEIESMLNDAPGPINFTQLINMFGQRQQGGAADDDDVVIEALKAFQDESGFIDADTIRHALMTWGEKYTASEVDDFFGQVEIDDNGKMECTFVCEMLTGKADQDDEAPPVEA